MENDTMKRVDLTQTPFKEKTGDECVHKTPNIVEDTVFYENGVPIGFYIRDMKGKLKDLIELANTELQSKRVPKSVMKRSSGLFKKGQEEVLQYSTILGGVPPKPHMRRPYPTISSVHSIASAKMFIKAMMMACKEAEQLIKEIMPEQYEFQKREIAENVPPKYRFGELFTSSISNCNIAVPFHTDRANLKGCVNVIIYKKSKDAKGGHLSIPEFGAVIEAVDNSMVVYPAWKSLHGVTPITTANSRGYRNSLVFYPLGSFKKYTNEEGVD